MAFECVHCGTVIEDDKLKVPRSGAVCPNCKADPTEGWSPYKTEIAEAGRKIADELNLRLLIHEPAVQDAALYFLEDLVMLRRHEVSIRLGSKPAVQHKCSVCGAEVPPDEGFRIEFYDRWRSTFIVLGLCETHLRDGLWGREFDIHMNHPDGWLIRGDWRYAGSREEQA
jgi:DNA-directed RNA polymerase subunit RPC12/RpoP